MTAALVRFDYVFCTSLLAYRGGPIVTCNDLYNFKGGEGNPKFFRGGGCSDCFYRNLLHLKLFKGVGEGSAPSVWTQDQCRQEIDRKNTVCREIMTLLSVCFGE